MVSLGFVLCIMAIVGSGAFTAATTNIIATGGSLFLLSRSNVMDAAEAVDIDPVADRVKVDRFTVVFNQTFFIRRSIGSLFVDWLSAIASGGQNATFPMVNDDG